ncbi:MAG: phage portal protein, partial [Alphaproteobacteria bacterium]
MSPDAYQARAGYRRSQADATVIRPRADAPDGGREFTSLNDPSLAAFINGGRETSTGIVVNEARALRNSTFFRAVSLISASIGMLPIHLMQRSTDGKAVKARKHPLYRVLHKRPNGFQTPSEFKSYMQTCALMDGNAYALIIRGLRGITALIPLKRGSVKPRLTDSWEVVFRYQRSDGGFVDLPASDVFHFRHPLSRDGLNGVSLLDVAAETIGLASAAETAASRIFKNGSMVGGALETDKNLGEEVIGRLRDSLEERFTGTENAGKWIVLEEGMKAKTLDTSAKDSMLIETLSHQAEEISRFTGVPRPLLMFDSTSWGTGIEQLGLFFITYCLLAWFVAWEEAIWRSCLTDSEQDEYFAKFNVG